MSDYRKFDAALQSAGVCYKTDEPMSAHTSFKIGGPADRFVEVKTVSELQAVLNAVSDENVPYFILGNGSNLLVPDEGLRGAVLTLQGDFKKVQSLANGHVLCGAGASLATVCSFARGQGLTGLEFAWGIPGQLGGAVYMNAGAYGGEMKQVVVRVHFLEADGTPGVMSGEDLAFGYRKSAFMGTKRIITSAELCLESGAEADKTLKAGKFKAKLTLPEGRKTAAVIIAKYVNGTLGDLKMSEPKETQAIIETDFITVTGEDLTKQTEIKAFVFESTENIKPMYGFQHIIK